MILRRSPEVEEAEDALLEGDRAITPGTARAALAHREFRIVWTGALLSNVGTWMQNVALGVLAYELTRSATFVAVVGFAQLGPLLFLAPVGGALADAVDRRTLLVVAQAEQLAFSLVLAWVARGGHPSKAALLACVLAVGMGNAINAPAFSAILPALVGPADLGGAVSLQSVQMNVSRVVGPAIGGLLLPRIGAAGVFTVNAVTYFFAIGGLLLVRLPHVAAAGGRGLRRLLGGFAAARENRLVGRCLLTITTVSFFCLPFIGLMPVLAARSFHINPRSTGYGFLYAAFGVGAALGAISVGTVLVQRSRARLVRGGLVSFGATLAAFALARSPAPAYV
ncbi:MAG: MFS transporter, partial [Actinobacteria bacterium]|nr:MFS transporter [Actinomycetota bacterium]